MPYTDLAKLTARFGDQLLLDLADRDGSGAVDAGVVDGAIADTDAVIDGYLAGRYKLPLATTPPLLADLAAAIAIYKLHTYEPDTKIAEDPVMDLGSSCLERFYRVGYRVNRFIFHLNQLGRFTGQKVCLSNHHCNRLTYEAHPI